MSHREELWRENPYIVRSGSELGAMDGMFSMPKLSVPKMFSKSATKTPAPAKEPAQAAPAQAKAPASRWGIPSLYSKAAVHEFTDLSGKTILIGDKSMLPKIFGKKGYTAPPPNDLIATMRDNPKIPHLMYDAMQRQFCLSADCKQAVACDWLHNSLPVFSCLMLKDDILMLCFVDGNLPAVRVGWRPFLKMNYMTKQAIKTSFLIPKKFPKVMWFTKAES